MTKWIRILVLSIIALDLVFLGHIFASRNTPVSVHEKIEHKISAPPVTAKQQNIETDEQLIENQVVRSTIQIVSAMGQGSAVVIYQDKKIAYILTALHVVSHPPYHAGIEYYGKFIDDYHHTEVPLKLIASDIEHDLALLTSAPVWLQSAKIVKKASDVRLYGHISTYGFLGRVIYSGVLTEGRISDFHNTTIQGVTKMLTSCPVINGNSGGGYWCKINGEYVLVGIVTSVFIYERAKQEHIICHVSMGAGPEEMLAFLKSAIADNK